MSTTWNDRVKVARATKAGDVWKHRRHGRIATVEKADGNGNVWLLHQTGRRTLKWYSYLASDFDLQSSGTTSDKSGAERG